MTVTPYFVFNDWLLLCVVLLIYKQSCCEIMLNISANLCKPKDSFVETFTKVITGLKVITEHTRKLNSDGVCSPDVSAFNSLILNSN